MGNLSSHLSEDGSETMKLLAMTRRVRPSPAEAEGMAAAALAVLLKLLPQQEKVTGHKGEDDSVDRSDVKLFMEALLVSVDKRIAALTRVLQAPDTDPQEVAAARAELARSKAYPELSESSCQDGDLVGLGEEPRGSMLDEAVLPKMEKCALELYQTLLSPEKSEEGDQPELDIRLGKGPDG